MRIATLQFAAKLGDVDGNIRKANELLKTGKLNSLERGVDPLKKGVGINIEVLRPDILVLPELALTGYNFPSLEAIKPYTEPTGKGPSAAWAIKTAKHLQCKICVGYPEVEVSLEDSGSSKYYNSLLVVDEHGNVIHNYRKSFLYYTDETWATEGNVKQGFHELSFFSRGDRTASATTADLAGDTHRDTDAGAITGANKPDSDALKNKAVKQVATSFGICMDINPYKFEAPYTEYEFANRVLDSKSQLVIVSMAWLTLASCEEMDALDGAPDMDTFKYWLMRMIPLLTQKMQHERNVDVADPGDKNGDQDTDTKKVVIVFANRAGEEPAADDTKPLARYAGTSTVVTITQQGSQASEVENAKILCWDLLGATEEGICFADTTADPKMVFGLGRKADE